jgi:putative hydrolase of the HAD superfamily
MSERDKIILVLDAMGVIFAEGHDVQNLIAPFVREHGGNSDLDFVEQAYFEASLGRIGPEEFWQRVGLSAELEDECLARHRLSDGIMQLLEAAPSQYERVVCLSNDVSRWSRKLRRMYSLEPLVSAWYISGDLGLRKPDLRIYMHLLKDLAADPANVIFVDDRVANLDPAAELGIRTVHYCSAGAHSDSPHKRISRLPEFLSLS